MHKFSLFLCKKVNFRFIYNAKVRLWYREIFFSEKCFPRSLSKLSISIDPKMGRNRKKPKFTTSIETLSSENFHRRGWHIPTNLALFWFYCLEEKSMIRWSWFFQKILKIKLARSKSPIYPDIWFLPIWKNEKNQNENRHF